MPKGGDEDDQVHGITRCKDQGSSIEAGGS